MSRFNLRRKVPWFHFWNPNSGWSGGLLASALLLLVSIVVKVVQLVA